MNSVLHAHLKGMGQTGQTNLTGAQIAHGIVGTVLSTAAAVDPEPISKAILAIGAVIQNFFFQPDYNKLATSQIVTKAESILQQNLSAWMGLSASEKTPAAQQAALQNFDTVWAQVQQACGSGQYGSAGQNCIGDRQQGGCHYEVSPGAGCSSTEPTCWVQDASGAWSLNWGGAAGSGSACWNWFVGYRDPIANDPQVAANVAAAASAVTGQGTAPVTSSDPSSTVAGAVSTVLGNPTLLLLLGAGVLGFFLVAEEA